MTNIPMTLDVQHRCPSHRLNSQSFNMNQMNNTNNFAQDNEITKKNN